MADKINEAILVNYNHRQEWTETKVNEIGATDSLTLRTVTAHSDSDSLHVRKFGVAYEITDVTDIEDPIDTDMTFEVYALDGTLLGSRTGGGAFVDGGTVTAQGCYLKVVATGDCTVLTGITIDTDVDVGGKEFTFPADVLTSGDEITYYLSATGSTYYDSVMRHGGARHTPDGTNDLPYFDISTAIAAVDSYHVIITVLDSETYDETLDLNFPSLNLQAALGQTPTITSGVGARVTREVTAQYNNLTACYFNENGDDGTGNGTWQLPYATPSVTITNRGSKAVVYGGTGATVSGGIFLITTALVPANFTMEADYGYTPVLKTRTYINTFYGNIGTGTNSFNLYGFTMDGGNIGASGFKIALSNNWDWGGNIFDNTVYGFVSYGIYVQAITGNIKRNKIYNSLFGIFLYLSSTGDIDKNIVYSCGHGIISYVPNTDSLDIRNNLIFSNTYGLTLETSFSSPSTGYYENNTCVENSYGIFFQLNAVGSYVPTVRNNICYHNTTYDLAKAGTGNSPTITESNYGTNSNWTIGAGCITTDPAFCKTTSPDKFGIQMGSGAYRTDTSSDDMGAHFRIMEMNESNITVNGFYIDGQEQYNNAIFKLDTVDHTGMILKWCSIYDFQGIVIDIYENDINTDFQILNCSIYNNGDGIYFPYGGNWIQESLIYNNINHGVYITNNTTVINHCIIFGHIYGLYNSNTLGSFSIIDSIINSNSLYGIYSEIGINITYTCIVDAVSTSVDTTDDTNIIDNPLFVNTNSGEEDFHIKTEENGYIKESFCKEVASDGYDIGAWLITRAVSSDAWKKYQFAFNPQVDWEHDAKGYSNFEDASGSRDNYAIAHKRRFIFNFGEKGQVSSEELRQKIEYFTTLIKTQENNLIEEQTKFRLHFQPTSYLVAKHTSTITDDSNSNVRKNITDTSKSWVENQWKGYHAGIISTSGTATGSIVGSTLVVAPSPLWTVNQWTGYSFPYGGYYYYILSNTADTLTLSNPDSTLSNVASINWTIEKYYKIRENNTTTLNVLDPEDDIITGTYDYYIDFIECKVFTDIFKYSMPRFLWTREHAKVGYGIIFEEI